MAAAAATTAPFKVGTKELYLPNFTLTLHRTRWLPPTQATFTVPLYFSKLDLRDYLYHAYSVRTLAIRSYIKLQRLRQGATADRNPAPQYKRWHRPKSVKRMTVELERPFVWPEPPSDFKAWNKEQVEMSEKEQKDAGERMGPGRDTYVNKGRRESMREQAKALLEGRARWKPPVEKDAGAVLRPRVTSYDYFSAKDL